MTNFPPPPDFDGEERGRWDEQDYERECTAAECQTLSAGRDLALAGLRGEEEAERESFFAGIRSALAADAP